MFTQSTVSAFILGFLASLLLALAFFSASEQAQESNEVLQNRQILLDTKLHLVEMKVDVITEQKSTEELETDYDRIMRALEQSHQYTGEGVVARDKAMREAAAMVRDALVVGGHELLAAIEQLLSAIETHLYSNEETVEEETTPQ